MPGYNVVGEPTESYVPLHKVPHYCFGFIAGMPSLSIYLLFSALHLGSDYEYTSFLSSHDQALWFDALLSPGITETRPVPQPVPKNTKLEHTGHGLVDVLTKWEAA